MLMVSVAREFVLHALAYLASIIEGSDGYSFVLDGFGVYSPDLTKDLKGGQRGRVVAKLRKASKLARELCRLVSSVECGYVLIYAARLHFIATRLYPPVDDPVEYSILRYPGMDRSVAESVLAALKSLNLI